MISPHYHIFKRVYTRNLQVQLKHSTLNYIQKYISSGSPVQNFLSCHASFQNRKQIRMICNEIKSFCVPEKSDEKILEPPSIVLGMKVLDTGKFKKDIEVPSVLVSLDKIKLAIKNFKPFFLKMPHLQPIIEDGNDKRMLLNPVLVGKGISKIEDSLKIMSLENLSLTKVQLGYENWNHDSVFKAVLPPEFGNSVSSFSIIGHIIHLNLKPHLMDYKFLIGQVLLDKYTNVKTVVNKTQEIGTEFRNFSMEVLAGEQNFTVTVKENGHQYVFDFSKVFWNPRLVNEHDQIVKKLSPGDLVYDVFAGVGPFAIPAAKKKCHVHANDLNPDSYHWLCHNAKLNKVDYYLNTYKFDGREFICSVIKKGLIEHWNKSSESSDVHIIMNLPASALEFLSSFQGLLKDENVHQSLKMPIVYCYCFLKKDEEIDTIIQKYFNAALQKNITVTPVRLVAPNKTMMRITFTIPKEYLLSFVEEPQAKKIKLQAVE